MEEVFEKINTQILIVSTPTMSVLCESVVFLLECYF